MSSSANREVDPSDSQVMTGAKYHRGEGLNVIPDSVTIGGTFRAFLEASFVNTKHCMEEVIIDHAVEHRCNATVDFQQIFFRATISEKSLHNHFVNVV
ncbi:hypothetical protein MLD38_004849 [Melastoma candidum]|uniref:Uncharacterized protein n=1 Tax=Melastoma candidum TaxID=119954 RepID=A0ACB9S7F5_9MYRT|nr:hypothetical protein MLD38_004849 [Melastoma candidum]